MHLCHIIGIEEVDAPFSSRELPIIGKPEPLKFVLADCWSRRITQEHRLVYRNSENRIDFLQARYHY
ncbi:MAG TPA: Txe/YoeB family addiction module toxin [Terriglobales bacterium]